MKKICILIGIILSAIFSFAQESDKPRIEGGVILSAYSGDESGLGGFLNLSLVTKRTYHTVLYGMSYNFPGQKTSVGMLNGVFLWKGTDLYLSISKPLTSEAKEEKHTYAGVGFEMDFKLSEHAHLLPFIEMGTKFQKNSMFSCGILLAIQYPFHVRK
ncbi:MAG: hypothetical protein KBB16_02015 [Candidatus Pacebacteria bacterium]|nr:hypothetical protein [Candidatus Paceibacterota bacterium]